MNLLFPNKVSDTNPDSGTLIIAEPYLNDISFARTVILLCEHGSYGTLGFVLNKPSTNTVNMLLPELKLPGVLIYDGGPVQTDTLQIIHQLPNCLSGIEIFPGVFWGASYEELARLCKKGRPVNPQKIRLFRGYSGWDAGQLDLELSQKSWLTTTAQKSIIFNTQSDKIWASSLKSMGQDFAYLANFPIDPILN